MSNGLAHNWVKNITSAITRLVLVFTFKKICEIKRKIENNLPARTPAVLATGILTKNFICCFSSQNTNIN